MSPTGLHHDITALVALRELATAACETVETADLASLMLGAKDVTASDVIREALRRYLHAS